MHDMDLQVWAIVAAHGQGSLVSGEVLSSQRGDVHLRSDKSMLVIRNRQMALCRRASLSQMLRFWCFSNANVATREDGFYLLPVSHQTINAQEEVFLESAARFLAYLYANCHMSSMQPELGASLELGFTSNALCMENSSGVYKMLPWAFSQRKELQLQTGINVVLRGLAAYLGASTHEASVKCKGGFGPAAGRNECFIFNVPGCLGNVQALASSPVPAMLEHPLMSQPSMLGSCVKAGPRSLSHRSAMSPLPSPTANLQLWYTALFALEPSMLCLRALRIVCLHADPRTANSLSSNLLMLARNIQPAVKSARKLELGTMVAPTRPTSQKSGSRPLRKTDRRASPKLEFIALDADEGCDELLLPSDTLIAQNNKDAVEVTLSETYDALDAKSFQLPGESVQTPSVRRLSTVPKRFSFDDEQPSAKARESSLARSYDALGHQFKILQETSQAVISAPAELPPLRCTTPKRAGSPALLRSHSSSGRHRTAMAAASAMALDLGMDAKDSARSLKGQMKMQQDSPWRGETLRSIASLQRGKGAPLLASSPDLKMSKLPPLPTSLSQQKSGKATWTLPSSRTSTPTRWTSSLAIF